MVTLDTSNCESEPIRFPGSIQAHGALIILDPDFNTIIAASESCEQFLGLSAQAILTRKLADIIGSSTASDLMENLRAGQPSILNFSLQGKTFSISTHLNADGQALLDIESADTDAALSNMLYKCRLAIKSLRSLTGLDAITTAAADGIREITDFDRVMIYRFDDAWNGEVIAEARHPDLEAYLGLNFPASDIPAQARELFAFSKVRQIPDVFYTPSALLSRGDSLSIDLGLSSLRSVSPMHIQYLKNMGARATLVGSLIVEGKLWGLVSCQQRNNPCYFPPKQRDIIGWLCADIAALIETTLIRWRIDLTLSLAVKRRRLADEVRRKDFKSLIQDDCYPDILNVVNADGFALLANDDTQMCGVTPTLNQIQELQQRRHALKGNSNLFASNALIHDLGPVTLEAPIAGALFVSIQKYPVTMIWFRLERRFSLRWGGDPNNPHLVDEAGNISPRQSFALFLETICGQSLPWLTEEIDSARELAGLIEIELIGKEQAFSQTLLDSSPDNIAIINTEGAIVKVNASWMRFAAENNGSQRAYNPVGINYKDICLADISQANGDANRAWAGIDAVLKKQQDYFTLEYPCDSPTQKRWFIMHVFAMIAPCEGVAVIHENITERKQAETLNAELLNRLNLIASRAPGVIYQFKLEPNGQASFLYVSEAVRSIYRLQPDELKNDASALLSVFHPDDCKKIWETLELSAKNLNPRQLEYRVRFPDGEIRWLFDNSIPNQDADGSVIWTGFITDISERKAIENKLKAIEIANQQRFKIEESSRYAIARQTATAIAHEINQPLTAIASYANGALQHLRAENFDKKLLEIALENAESQAQRAGDAIQELMNVLYQVKYTTEQVEISHLIDETLSLLLPGDGFDKIKLSLQICPEPVFINVVPLHIEKILINLLRNACQAIHEAKNPNGEINLIVRRAADNSILQVTVQDNGIGLKAQNPLKVFQPFYSTKVGGLGMALTISQSLIESYGGKIWSEPNPGPGVSFHFTLPIAR